MAAGVEVEGARFAHEMHARLRGELIAFATVAGMTTRDQIFPSRRASSGAGNDVVERQLARHEDFAAVLAGIAVAKQDIFSRKGPALVRNSAVFKQADYRGDSQCQAGGMQIMAVLLFGHRDTFEHEHNSAAGCANIDRLVGGVQNQHRRVQR